MEKHRSVITICSLLHKDVWSLTSNLLPRMVVADSYHVFVPRAEIPAFEEFTGSQVQIHSQESLSFDYHDALAEAVEASGNSQRFGWYLQQFHKIRALQVIDAEELVIWDADCVPLSKIPLFSADGVPIYMTAAENHGPYFEVIQRLLGLERVQRQSFVIPGFPILKSWVEDFLAAIRLEHYPLDWFDAIISCTDFSQQSGFSETETLGTWVANTYPHGWLSSNLTWERRGQSRFGYAASFSPDTVVALGRKEGLDIVTFENWDLPKGKGSRPGLSKPRLEFLHFLNGRGRR